MVVRFIHNLIHRHPSLVKMIDNEATTMIDDPFDNDEKDPAKSNASGSSLWEIKTLEEHVLPQVSAVAKDLIEKGLREMELDFASHLENSYEEMFEKETKKKIFTNVPVNWEMPDGLKMKADDIFSQIIDVSSDFFLLFSDASCQCQAQIKTSTFLWRTNRRSISLRDTTRGWRISRMSSS